MALVVLGCFLYGRGKEEWESALEYLEQSPHKDINDVLKLSFDGLDEKQKKVFLDMVFTVNEGYDGLNLIRHLYGSSINIVISVLIERSLISVHCANYINVLDLLRRMGLKEISRQKNSDTHVRLWKHDDIYDYFICDRGIEAIRYILDTSKIRRTTWRASRFQKMHNLVFLKVYKSDRRKPSNLIVCEDLDYLSEELRFLSWEEYPHPYVPLHFCADNLISRQLIGGNIQQLWDGDQHFPNLDRLVLHNLKHIPKVLDLSPITPKIHYMSFGGCDNLSHIHSSTVFKNAPALRINLREPVQITVGGSIKRASSGLVIVYEYLDLWQMLFVKLTLELLICGEIICGIHYKYAVMPLKGRAELREGARSLASLLPFVRMVDWFEGPIECGDAYSDPYKYAAQYDFCRIPTRASFRLVLTVRDATPKCDNENRKRPLERGLTTPKYCTFVPIPKYK